MPINFRPTYHWGKSAFDRLFSAALLVILSPIMAAIAIAVCSTPGPIIYRQERVGRNGRKFSLLKFRTMRVNTEHEVAWTVKDDQRVTAIGKFLRATSLDELPQLINVLRGEMSIVGPRPERPHFVRKFSREIPAYFTRHTGQVGITGLAQIEGLRGDTSIEKRLTRDLYYLSHWSFGEDLRIIAKTIPVMLRRSAY